MCIMSPKKLLFLCDVDGTLTKPRQVISKELFNFLMTEVKPLVSLGLVSGSDYPKIAEQMGGEDMLKEFDYIFCENGVMFYKGSELKSEESLLKHVGEQKLQKIINFALSYMSRLELPAKRGNFVEFRASMINICPVGRSCNQNERDEFSQYDKQHNIRQQFVDALSKEFNDYGLKFALGGQISVDVFPLGWDKTHCLKHLPDNTYDEIHFFGDKTCAGGNDYEIYNDTRTIGHTVSSPDDTKQQMLRVLDDMFTK